MYWNILVYKYQYICAGIYWYVCTGMLWYVPVCIYRLLHRSVRLDILHTYYIVYTYTDYLVYTGMYAVAVLQ